MKMSLALATATFSSGIYYWHYYNNNCCKVPRIIVSEGIMKEILKDVPNLNNEYKPTPWLINTNLMTIAGVIRRYGGNPYDRELLIMRDGGTIGLDWYKNSNEYKDWSPNIPIVLVLHGITGGSQEGYCRWMCASAHHYGWRSVVFNYRGCNNLPVTSAKSYSPVDTADLRFVINYLKKRYPKAPLCAAAYSLGSLMLCKYIGECEDMESCDSNCPLDAVALVSNPCCMYTSKEKISQPWTVPWIFNLIITLRIQMHIFGNKKQYEKNDSFNFRKLIRCRSISDIEEEVYRFYDANSLEEYYHRGSSQTHIPKIKTKTLILVSEDDPFIGNLPIKECESNSNTALAVTSFGGHVAFLQGVWPFGKSWMDDTVMQFFISCLKNSSR